MRSPALAVLLLAAVATLSGAPQSPSAPPGGASGANARSVATGLILGRTVDADSGKPVAGITITLTGSRLVDGSPVQPGAVPPPSLTALSNADGHFLFRDLPKGSYALSTQGIAFNGYLPSRYGQRRPEAITGRAIDLADGQRVLDADIRMWKAGSISGRVIDEAGEPLSGIGIRSLRRDASGRWTFWRSGDTDDRGVYRLAGLVPGEYIVMAPSTLTAVPVALSAALASSSGEVAQALSSDVPALGLGAGDGTIVDGMQILRTLLRGNIPAPTPSDAGRIRAYPTTFRPGTLEPGTSTPVRIGPGTEADGVDMQLQLTSMFRISGVARGPDGPMPNFGIRLVPAFASRLSSDANFETSLTATGPDGRFTFLGVPPGQYEIRALRIPRPQQPVAVTTITAGAFSISTGEDGGQIRHAPVSTDPTLWARQPVTVANDDVSGVVLTMQTGTRMRGQIVFDGTPPSPAERAGMAISLQLGDEGAGLPAPVAPVDADLRFTTAEYPDGTYFLAVNAPPPGWRVVSATFGGSDVLGLPFTLDRSKDGDVIVTLGKQTTALSGQVRGARPGDPDATVLMFPADVRAWIASGMSTRQVRMAAVEPNGSYKYPQVPPGRYAVVAIPATAAVDTRDAELVERLAGAATRVTLAPGDQKTQPLTVTAVR